MFVWCFMMFNATFINISIISWRSVLLEEDTRWPGENHRPVASCIILYTSPWSIFELTTSVVIGTDCICSCLSNYHVITATTIPIRIENTITLNHGQKNAKEHHKINLDGQVTYKTPICLEIKKTSVKHTMLIRENSRQNHTYLN
jgi:hypothetical protein